MIDRAMELDHVGTVYTSIHRPTRFICLVLKLLQIGPSMDIVLEFINNEDYKFVIFFNLYFIYRYVTALGMFYLRLVGTPELIYKTLEPFYSDFRKLRLNTPEGWKIIHMDEFVDELLENQMAFTISLPLLPARKVLELRGDLLPRESVLDEEFEEMAAELEKEDSKESESKRVKTK